MISKIDKVYKRAAEENNLDPTLVKSIGDTVFQTLKDSMTSMEQSSVYIAHIGNFIVKSVKIRNQLIRYLQMRKYIASKYPDALEKPVSKRMKALFNLYFTKIIPFKKLKKEVAEKQVAFCKKTYESYEEPPDKNSTTNKYTSNG